MEMHQIKTLQCVILFGYCCWVYSFKVVVLFASHAQGLIMFHSEFDAYR
jgi:hypothetical protein